MKVSGGKTLYGASVGILMLDAQFPRVPGDVGNATSWNFPVHYKIVRGASPDLIVRKRAEGMLEPFINAAQDLVRDGVDGITTNCGFLSLFQDELSGAVGVPVATSSLMQVEMVNRMLPKGRRAGVLTISESTLTPDHLACAGAPLDTPIVGTEEGQEFSRVILGDLDELDLDLARQDNVEAAASLVRDHPDVGAIVLECTNMCPYASDISNATGLPTFSMISFIEWFQSGLRPRIYRQF